MTALRGTSPPPLSETERGDHRCKRGKPPRVHNNSGATHHPRLSPLPASGRGRGRGFAPKPLPLPSPKRRGATDSGGRRSGSRHERQPASNTENAAEAPSTFPRDRPSPLRGGD